MTRVLIFLAFCSFVGTANSAFRIDFPDDIQEVKRLKDSTLIINKATEFLVHVGTGSAEPVPGGVDTIAIRDAMLLLTPEGWRAYSNGVDLDNVVVDFIAGEPWTGPLKRAGEDYGMIFTVDWNRKEIHIQPHTEIGEFDVSGVPYDESTANIQGPKQLHLQAGDLRKSLELFAGLNGMKLEVDVFTEVE